MNREEIKELFSRPGFPDEPAFTREIDRLYWAMHNSGKKPGRIIVTPEISADIDGYLDKVEIFNKAWGIKTIRFPPGLPMVRAYRCLNIEVGDKLEVLETS